VDIRQTITNMIISMIEAGIKNEKRSLWDGSNSRTKQINFKTGEPYTGVNVLILWLTALERNLTTSSWLTYDQALKMGGQVKRGAKGVLCARWQQMSPRDGEDGGTNEEGSAKKRPALYMIPFWVFNTCDVEGLSQAPEAWTTRPEFEVIEDAERIISASGIEFFEGGQSAFYRTRTDRVRVPDRRRFERAVDFYHVALHELTHATGHETRLNREHCGKFGSPEYAFEELVAELGSAFLMAHIGLEGSTMSEHASYLESWLRVLKNDKDAIFKASRQANMAYQYLIERAGMGQAEQHTAQ
jgi:antirestriction protein ArdC